MNQGIYEELVTQLVSNKINKLDKNSYFVNKSKIDKEEASIIISRHLSKTIKGALDVLKGEHQIEHQIEIANKIIQFLKVELNDNDFDKDLIESEGEILKAVFTKIDAHFSDLDIHLKEITPYTRLTHSELFTGGSNTGLSLESELKKEILSSNRIDLLVSFIKFKGIIILERELKEFTQRGGQLRVITTTYMGASDYKAIQLLSKLENTQVKISYNTGNERLHAKAYLFYRNTGFHTGYIGSSNFSRSALTDGLEWNVKITTKEVSHIIDKFQKTFDSYWKSDDFEIFDDNIHKAKLIESLNKGKDTTIGAINPAAFFDLKPYPFQNEILEKLEVERTIHNRYRNLVVAATGTGKTIISVFDYKNFKKENNSAKLLFLAHRKEILEQALSTFQGVLRDNNFG
ncbi:MAG: DEAD/DEAH box helicase family protein, partial [Chitinophagales bacterium]